MSADTVPTESLPSLLELAASQLAAPSVDGLVYIHPVYGGAPEYVLLTAERFNRMMQPLTTAEVAHGHAEPGMREDLGLGEAK